MSLWQYAAVRNGWRKVNSVSEDSKAKTPTLEDFERAIEMFGDN